MPRDNPDQPDGRLQIGPICVVDDDESVRDSLRSLLVAMGFSVTTYASGGEILADMRCREAGCLIVDQHMPGMDGLQTLAALRGDGPSTPAILITGRTDAAIVARAAELGVTAILDKPFSATRLLEVVREVGRASP